MSIYDENRYVDEYRHHFGLGEEAVGPAWPAQPAANLITLEISNLSRVPGLEDLQLPECTPRDLRLYTEEALRLGEMTPEEARQHLYGMPRCSTGLVLMFQPRLKKRR